MTKPPSYLPAAAALQMWNTAPSVSTRQRVIHLHRGDACAVLTARALDGARGRKAAASRQQTHIIAGKNTSNHHIYGKYINPTNFRLSLPPPPPGSVFGHR
ncbi:hypothetical protein EYF80_031068 [Liparis tanakae]|uniref:Uncharacterized protein n=1 Tax=Liparis tanakae TaxID=230148 RepID=A0A4Z2H0Z3_9TELE|nr:hypothetical protein EYF80_031068 [Liparis tanakae]